MEKKIQAFLKENSINIKDTIICAVSGGADSVCLLSVLHKLGYSLVLAHVNHHKRKESELEEAAMKDLALSFHIPFELLNYYYDGEDNFHNDSHHARYQFFHDLAKKYHTSWIATAHHRDDQIETILMKLMEGSNLYGYGGISICKQEENISIIRPLLCVDKEEIYTYAKKENLTYFEDSSNHEDDFLRNRIRHHVVPLLKEECFDLGEKLQEYSIQAHEAFQFIRNQSIKYLKENNNGIDIPSFSLLDIALKKDILSLLLEKNNIRKNKDIIYSMLAITKDSRGTKSISLENKYCFVRNYDRAILKKIDIENRSDVFLFENEKITLGNYRFYFTNSHNNIMTKHINLCYNDVVFPVCIRYRQKGDTIQLGMGTKRVSRVLIDQKVPKDIRDTVPVIVNGDGTILWIYDYAKSDLVHKSKNTGDIELVCEVLSNEE